MPLTLDHVVVLAASLADGVEWVEDRLGQPPGGGGRHEGMGTHNALWRLGDAYLEVIAADPEADPPRKPRWFGLDDPGIAVRLVQDGPQPLAWAVAVDDLEEVPAPPGGVALDPAETCRRGDLEWQIRRPKGRAPALGGAWPLFIRWGAAGPAAARLPETGLALDALEIRGPAARAVRRALGTVRSPAALAWSDRADTRLCPVIRLADGNRVIL